MPGLQVISSAYAEALQRLTSIYNHMRTKLDSHKYKELSQDGLPINSEAATKSSSLSSTSLWTRSTVKRAMAATATVVLVVWAARFIFFAKPSDRFLEARRRMSKEEYIEAVLKEPVEGLVDYEPIRHRCNMAVPRPGLVWQCDFISGGLGNLGNYWQSCMFFGIEAGASAIILPQVGQRDDNNLIDNGNKSYTVGLDFLYDVDYFVTQWREVCPQIQMFRSANELPSLAGSTGVKMAPNEMRGLQLMGTKVVDFGAWRARFDKWAETYIAPDVLQAPSLDKKPMHVVIEGLLFSVDRASLDPRLAHAFSRMFRFKSSLRRLGAAVLWHLEQATGHPVVSDRVLLPALYAETYYSQPPPPAAVNTSQATHLERLRVLPQSFLGVHLRADSDAVKMKWPGYDVQAPAYIGEAQRRNMTTIFLAAGTPEAANRFKKEAAVAGLTVYVKEDLMDAADRAAYDALTWDNRAVVDFEVLLHAGFFVGFGPSTFSQVMAVRRSTLPDAGINQVNSVRPFTDASFEVYRDNLSSIYCGRRGQTLDAMWP